MRPKHCLISTEIFKKDRQMSYLIAKDSDAMILELLI